MQITIRAVRCGAKRAEAKMQHLVECWSGPRQAGEYRIQMAMHEGKQTAGQRRRITRSKLSIILSRGDNRLYNRNDPFSVGLSDRPVLMHSSYNQFVQLAIPRNDWTAIRLSGATAILPFVVNGGPLAEQVFVGCQTHFSAVAQMVGFGLGRSKILFLSTRVD
jgi:hypothetical protein